MDLYDHQKKLLEKNPAKHLIAWGTGVGKTHGALALAKKNNATAIIVCPKALKENWRRHIQPFNTRHVVMSKEEFKRDALTLPPYDALIIDECHNFAAMSSQLSKSLDKYLKKHKPPFVWLLSATPLTSTPWSIYRLANYLGYEINYWSFKVKYFDDIRMGGRLIPKAKKGMETELSNLVKSIGDVVALEDVVDLPPQIFETEYIELTAQQISAIKKLDDATHIARFTHTNTIENGIKISDGYTPDEYYECLKNDRITSICGDNPKVAVFCRYNLQIKMLKELLKKNGHTVLIISGEVKDRDVVVQQANKLKSCVVLIQSDTSEGYELPSIPVIIFASLSFSYLKYVQAIGRFSRINALKKNVYIHLVTKGGTDEAIYDCIQKKEDFYIELYNK